MSSIVGGTKKVEHTQRHRNRGVRGVKWPHRNLPVGQTWYFDPQIFFWKNILWYTPTRCYWGYII